jgi:hypothetical protein
MYAMPSQHYQGNRTAADSQFDLAFTHMDLTHFNVFMEKNYNGGGNLNFITGAGGYDACSRRCT